jgi:hypothetical protein
MKKIEVGTRWYGIYTKAFVEVISTRGEFVVYKYLTDTDLYKVKGQTNTSTEKRFRAGFREAEYVDDSCYGPDADSFTLHVDDGFIEISEPSSFDKQVGGTHYNDMVIQPIEFIMANDLSYCEANILKYVCPHHSKGGRQDIEKVIHYAEMLLEAYDNEHN